MIIKNKINDIAEVLLEAAKNCKTIPYPAIYEIFKDTNISHVDIWDTFEATGRKIAPLDKCIFGALLRDKTGLPKEGFFDIYKIHRSNEYFQIVGDKNILGLTKKEKEIITNKERQRIWDIFCINILPVKIFSTTDKNEKIKQEVLERGLAIIIEDYEDIRKKIYKITKEMNEYVETNKKDYAIFSKIIYQSKDIIGILYHNQFYSKEEAEKIAIEIYKKTMKN
jgi:hypothetical protein